MVRGGRVLFRHGGAWVEEGFEGVEGEEEGAFVGLGHGCFFFFWFLGRGGLD